MANEKTPVVWDDTAKKHRPLGSGEKMGGLSASSMISTDSGNLLQQGSDGLMLVTGGSIADPRADNLLEESANGKLQVTSDRVVEWLEGHPQAAAAIAEAVKVVSGDAGNVITAGTDKGAFLSKQALSNAVSTMSAAQLTTLANALRKQGGGLSVGSDGKLSVDFGSMDPAIMRNVVLSMVQQGGGISVDQSGKLYVDFDSMPTTKFEAMMKSLKMLVPLDATKQLYVNKGSSAASDTLDDGRGTQAKPFKTIQACVNYLTSTYSLGNYNAFINIVANTYTENVSLPSYSSGRGTITLRADSGSRDVVIRAAQAANGFTLQPVSVTGSTWILEHLSVEREETVWEGANTFQGMCLYVTGKDSVCHLRGCRIAQSFPSNANLPGTQYGIRLMSVDNGGTLRIRPYDIAMSLSFSDTATHDRMVYVFSIQRGSTLLWERPLVTPDIAEYSWDIACSGSCTKFLYVTQGGSVQFDGGSTRQEFSGTVTGKRYEALNGSFISGSGSETYYPGDVAGTVEAATYCWYA